MAYPKAVVIRLPKAVLPLILVNIFMFILQSVIGPSFTQHLILDTSSVLYEPWTLITSMFLHGDFSHILFNMYALLMFGPLIEQRIGTRRFLQMYFGSGILAGLGFVLFREFIVGVSSAALGASGAIMGVFGMTIMLLPHMKVLFFFVIPMSMRTAGIVFAIIDLIGVFTPNNVANVAHLVGLVVGIIYAKQLLGVKKKYQKDFARPFTQNTRGSRSKKSLELDENDIQEYLKKGHL